MSYERMLGMGTTTPATTMREIEPQEQERREAVARARSEREVFMATLPTLRDQELADLVSANKRAYWEAMERGDVSLPSNEMTVAALTEYQRRSRVRSMPPIQEPMDIQAYRDHSKSEELTDTLDDIFGRRGIAGHMVKGYAANAVYAITGIESDYARGSRIRSAAITAVPIAAGGIAYKLTGGSIIWTGVAAIGSIPAMAGIVLALFWGGLWWRGGDFRY